MNATSSAPVRLVRGLGALVLLAVVLVGLPWLLVRMGQLHDPRTWSWRGFIQLFTTRDNGSTLLGVVTLIAWLAWLVFAIATVAELVVALSRQRISIRLPGLHGAQLVAGGLLLAVAAMVVSPLQAAATPGDPAPAPRDTPNRTAHVQTVDDNQAPTDNQHAAPRHAQSRRPASVVYTVKAGDDLWSLADQFYGDGAQWRKIAHANHTLLSGGPDELLIGWELTIPDVPAAPSSPGNSAASAATTVTVRPGDTLSSIADAHYGEAGRWTMIFDANRGVISDPDRIEVGWQLELPAVGQQEPAQHDQNQAGHRSDQHRSDRHRSDRHPGVGEDPGRPAAPKTRPTAPPSEQPSPGGTPTQAQSGDATSQPGQPPPVAAEAGNPVESLVAAGSIGGLLAASLLSGLLARREWQLMHRPIGRRIPQPAPVSQRLESAIGRQSEPLTLQSLDLAMRAIARHCQASGAVPPDLELVLADENRIDFQLSGPVPEPPTGFAAVASGWRLDRGSQAYLESITGIGSAPRLWPALISVGRAPSVGRRQQQQADRTEAGSHVLINLEAAGVFTLRPTSDQSAEDSAAQVTGALTAVAMELAFSWWASDLRITVVGRPGEDEPDWLAALGLHNVSWTTDIDQVISRAEVRARAQRAISATTRTAAHPDGPPLSAHRLDPATADAWTPELLVCTSQLRADHVNKLERLLLEGAPVSLAAVRVEDATVADLTGRRAASSVSRPSKDWSMELRVDGPGRLEPAGLTLLPQLVETQVRSALVDLVATTGRDDTVPASWWWQASRADGGEPEPPRPAINSPVPGVETPSPTGARPDQLTPAVPRDGVDPSRAVRPDNAGRPDNTCDPENVTFLHGRHPADLLDAGQSNRNPTSAPDPTRHVGAPRLSEETAPMTEDPRPAGTPAAPVVRLLGPIDLLGAGGPPPPRATMQCVEYCAWLLEHPGATAMQMADALCIAEGTRRSNMSRLRSWLGDDAGGEPYLPDAYSGRIRLSSVVSSDWLRLQLLVSGGVNRASRTALVGALELVRGAPLADAAPGQWYWAQEMRTDMVSMIRDIGIELARLAIDDKEIDLARWAAHRGLAAAPGDELLMCERIRTEFSAGNPGEMERLVLQVQGRARSLGVDLHTETVELMQQVVEGHLRIRQA